MIGALIIDKPAGFTSHDIVARVRRATGTRRVGHAGTLDPFATGVLVCCIGAATRLVQFLVGLEKEYIATVRLGYATDTQDGTGQQITPVRSSSELGVDDLQRVLLQFKGPQLQTPPMFSAKKVGGERLYRAAREGREVERQAVNITIHELELIQREVPLLTSNNDETREFGMRVKCSSGTYIRTLAHDIGRSLGVGAHLINLRRTKVGKFDLSDSLTLDQVESMPREDLLKSLVDPSTMLSHLAAVELKEDEIRKVTNGRAVNVSGEQALSLESGQQQIRLCNSAGALIAIGEFASEDGLIRPQIVLVN